MADYPQILPYVIKEPIGSDNFYTHYRASHTDNNKTFIVTEFNPSFMVRRTEEGELEATERFILEYETALERFHDLSDAMHGLNEPFIAPVEEVLKKNNTGYLIRELGGRYKSLDMGLGSTTMDYFDAHNFLRPLILGLISAWARQLLFQFKDDEVVLTPYNQLVLDSVFAWEGDHRHSITQLIKLYYRLMAGVAYNPGNPENPALEDLGMPQRLLALVSEILKGEPHYGSIDDFSKHLRTAVESGGRRETAEFPEEPKRRPVPPKIVKKGAATGLIAGVAGLIILLVVIPIAWVIVIQNPADYEYYADAGIYENGDALIEPPLAAQTTFVRLHKGYAITAPRDPTIVLNGSFYMHGNNIFHVQGGDGLAQQNTAGGATNNLATGVRPAFITAYDGYVYFTDGLADYNIRRVGIDGSGLETISGYTASFLHIHGNYLYFTNHNNRDFLYRLNLSTLQSSNFLNLPAYETVFLGSQLFFVNGASNFRIYSATVSSPVSEPVRMNQANSDNLRVAGGHIFYRNVEDNTIERISPYGLPLLIDVPIMADSFDIDGTLMAIVEAETNALWFYDMATGDLQSTDVIAAYVYLRQGIAYALDFNDINSIHTIRMAIGEEIIQEEVIEEEIIEEEV